jgi:hypothetical protein
MKFDILNDEFFSNLYFSEDESDDDDFFDHPMSGVGDHSLDDDEMNFIKPLQKRSTNTYFNHEDRLKSHIFSTYLSEEAETNGVSDKDTRLGKKFRQKFRVPYSVFIEIVQDIRRAGYKEKSLVTKRPAVPLALLILACLRINASGCPFDMAEDLTHVHLDTIRRFYYQHFNFWGVRKSATVIKMPSTETEFRQVTGLYERIGYPGCAGSIDCVHVVWDRCPADMFHSCNGKNGVTTLAFEVVGTHEKKILHVSQAFWGTINDMNISQIDEVFFMLKGKGKFANHPLSKLEWYSCDAEGNETKNYGAWLLCDGGYHDWPCLACPFKDQPPGPVRNWSKSVESTRKDIECIFGILKKKFLILKNPIRQEIKENIERMFLTCCVIHNMTMEAEGKFDDWMEFDEDEEEYDPLAELVRRTHEKRGKNAHGVAGTRSENRTMYNVKDGVVSDTANEQYLCEKMAHRLRKARLVEHYDYLKRKKLLRLHLR